MNTTRPPLIVHAVTKHPSKKKQAATWELETRLLKSFLGGGSGMESNKKKKKGIYNVYEVDPDFENCNGWSLTVNKRNSHQLKGSNVGFLVVNLTSGSMMGPHWNPRAWEIGIVTSDEPGVVRVGCSSTKKSPECKNWSFVVGKGDVFVVPRFHPMAQMSFNNGTFVFVGFSTTNGHNMPQFFAGSSSVLQTVGREVLAWSFDVNVSTIDRLLGARVESVILECGSCAEEEVKKMEEEAEREREKEEERKRKREEEERKRKEEEEKKKREEEEEREREEQRKREEEEERKREEEEAKREEERRRREEEERRREEEEERKREEEEERRRREEEEEEEEEKRKREEEERRGGERERRERRAEREEEEAWEREKERRRREAEREAGEKQRRRWEEEEGGEEEEEEPILRILGQWT